MRIIAGSARGRKLKPPEDCNIRPTADRIKEAVFNMIAFDIPGKNILDLFAGTGSLGLEAISRGAAMATFVEKDRQAFKTLIENIELLGFKERADVFLGDALDAIRRMGGRKQRFDIIFVDPPYNSNIYQNALNFLISKDIVNRYGIVIVEHPSNMSLRQEYPGLRQIKNKGYGNTSVSIFKREDNDENSSLPR